MLRRHALHGCVALYGLAIAAGGCDRITGLSSLEKVDDDDAGTGAGGSAAGVCDPTPEDGPCYTCLKASCCDAMRDCTTDIKCFCLLDCIAGGGTTLDCVPLCGPGSSPLVGLLFECHADAGCNCL